MVNHLLNQQFIIDVTDVEDWKVSGNTPVLESVASEATKTLESNGRVVLKRSYDNAPDDVYKIYNDPREFERDWKANFFHVVY